MKNNNIRIVLLPINLRPQGTRRIFNKKSVLLIRKLAYCGVRCAFPIFDVKTATTKAVLTKKVKLNRTGEGN